jgi:formylglycine-generating enzyme required for sulfatase activity
MPPDESNDETGSPKHLTTHPPGGEITQTANEVIEPIVFSPVGSAADRQNRGIKTVPLIIIGVLLISGILLWFLLSSRAVTITTTPAYAKVDITGGLKLALADRHLLRPGEHHLRITATGFSSYEGKLVVSREDNQTHNIKLEKLPGHLQIATTPAGAAVTIDSEDRGLTPLIISKLPPGTYNLTITAQRYLPIKQTVDVEGLDQTIELNLDLVPAWGHIELSSEPAGAVITVSNIERGLTPASVPVLASGEKVKISLTGYKPWQALLNVPVGELRKQPPVVLLPADGQIHLSSRPSGASIMIDGQFTGTTPADALLTPNENHRLELFLDGYEHFRGDIIVNSGEQRQLAISLKAELGSLKITAEPVGAQLFLNGKLKGSTPLTLNLPAHQWKVEVRKKGYTSQQRTIAPKPGVGQSVHFSLKSESETQWQNIASLITTQTGQKLKLFKPKVTFNMGASRREQGRRANELLRETTLGRPFYLATTEISNEQFHKFRSQHSSSSAGTQTLNHPDQPVVNITWDSAALFCNWLSQQHKLKPFYIVNDDTITGIDQQSMGFRLPTEAEWAWAARWQSDGSMRKFPWGSNFPPTDKVANIADRHAKDVVIRHIYSYSDGHAASAPVGTYPASSKGLYDMGGNVSEWLNDYYSIAIGRSATAKTDPVGPENGEYRVIRGASWRHSGITELRLSFRDYGKESRDDLGFRIARYAR